MSSHKGDTVPVVLVEKRNAKTVKSALEACNLLNKNFRMVPAEMNGEVVSNSWIALPVVADRALAQGKPSLEDLLESETGTATPTSGDGTWVDFIESTSTQWCPYSTAVLGTGGRHKKNKSQTNGAGAKTPPNRVVQAILNTVHAMGKEIGEHDQSQDERLNESLLAKIEKMDPSVCPKSLEVFGDDRTLVVSTKAFQGRHFWSSILDVTDQSDLECCQEEFWKQLAKVHNESPRVARRGTIDPNSRIRKSGHQLLYPRGHDNDDTSGPGSPGWITVTEQGIKQSLDMTRVMFSRGNISEKIRFGKLVKEGERLLDLYAGIGYYTLPALIHGKAAHVTACEWNNHAVEALRYNIHDNGVDDRVDVLVGDCRLSAKAHGLVDMFDRVSLGLLPSSEGGWRTAVRALKNKSGGWLHIHANVPVNEADSWFFWACEKIYGLCQEENKPDSWVVVGAHLERVKSFAPTVAHYVLDVHVGDQFSSTQGMTGFQCGVVRGGKLDRCPQSVPTPSCALSTHGVLSQEWMR